MSYSDNAISENERATLLNLGWIGLAAAIGAFACHAIGYDGPFAWLLTIMAASIVFSHTLNYRARDEFFDKLLLAGARWALSVLGIWVTLLAFLALFTRSMKIGPASFLTDQMTMVGGIMAAYFAGFCAARWRSN